MTFAFNWFGVPAVFVMVLALALAVVVYAARPDRLQNRILALLLVVEGASVAFGLGFIYMTTSVPAAFAFQVLREATLGALPGIYLLFLATLDSPLVRPLRTTTAKVLVAAGSVAAASLAVLFPERYVGTIAPVWYAPLEADAQGWAGITRAVGALVLLYGFLVAASVYIRKPKGTIERKRAAWYALGFGTRDLLTFAPLVIASGISTAEVRGPNLRDVVVLQSFAVGVFALVVAVTYAVLRYQLFDIDLKVKWTLRKSTIVAVFAVAFLVGSELVERLLGVEGELFGLAAAVAVGFVFRRVERLAGRIADRLMPGVEDTIAYRGRRATEIYVAALKEAAADGSMTGKDRRMLDVLRRNLGLTDVAASRLEAEMTHPVEA